MNVRIPGLMALALVVAMATDSQANLITNPDFAVPGLNASGYNEFYAGTPSATGIPGWTVTGGSVDVVGTNFYAAGGGASQSLDLDGFNPGTITQSIATTVGTSYVLTFLYANNPNNPAFPTATANVLIGGSLVGGITHTSGTPYVLATYGFIATSTTTSITFASTDAPTSNAGIALNAVNVFAGTVPEPASIAMVGLGLVGFVGVAARKARRGAK